MMNNIKPLPLKYFLIKGDTPNRYLKITIHPPPKNQVMGSPSAEDVMTSLIMRQFSKLVFCIFQTVTY